MREAIDLALYGKGIKKTKKDRIVMERFPDAKIFTLLGNLKTTKGEKIVDNLLGFLTDAPFGIPEFINSVKNLDKEFYLVEKNTKQVLVCVTDEFIESHELENNITDKKFSVGDWNFTNCGLVKNSVPKNNQEF